MPVLVLGVGYLGVALAERLCADGERVVGFDNGFAVDVAEVHRFQHVWPGEFTLRIGDIRDPAALDDAFAAAAPVETVYLLAAQASARPDASTPEYTEETNLRGPRLVLEAARRHGGPPVVYGSSFHVYGAPLAGTVDESRPYGAFRDLQHLSKVYAEKLGELYANEHGVPFAPVRLGIVYGVGPIMKRDLRFVTVPHAFCLLSLAGQPLTISESGLAALGFIHLDDAVRALRAAKAPGYAPANAVGEVASVADVARAVSDAATARGLTPAVTLPEGTIRATERYAVSSRLANTGWKAERTLAKSVPEIMAHYAS